MHKHKIVGIKKGVPADLAVIVAALVFLGTLILFPYLAWTRENPLWLIPLLFHFAILLTG